MKEKRKNPDSVTWVCNTGLVHHMNAVTIPNVSFEIVTELFKLGDSPYRITIEKLPRDTDTKPTKG